MTETEKTGMDIYERRENSNSSSKTIERQTLTVQHSFTACVLNQRIV